MTRIRSVGGEWECTCMCMRVFIVLICISSPGLACRHVSEINFICVQYKLRASFLCRLHFEVELFHCLSLSLFVSLSLSDLCWPPSRIIWAPSAGPQLHNGDTLFGIDVGVFDVCVCVSVLSCHSPALFVALFWLWFTSRCARCKFMRIFVGFSLLFACCCWLVACVGFGIVRVCIFVYVCVGLRLECAPKCACLIIQNVFALDLTDPWFILVAA